MLASAVLGTPAHASAAVPAPAPFTMQTETLQQYVEDSFADTPVMIAVSHCESKFRQYGENGTLLRGDNPDDIGVMQINEHYHGAEAKAMGIDLYTIEGNVEFARYLYGKQGVIPWLSSSRCWDKNGQYDGAIAMNK